MEIPWAGHPGLDLEPARPTRRFIVNVEREGKVYFKGMRWSLDPKGRARALDALTVEARSAARHGQAGNLPLVALLRVDYRRPWAEVREVLGALREPSIGIAAVHWAVASPAPDAWVASRLELVPDAGPDEAAAVLPIDLGVAEGADGAEVAEVTPRVQIGDDRFPFAPGDPYAAGAANDLGNRSWRAIAARLGKAKAGGTRVAALTLDDRVPWAYVAMTVGLLIDAGIDRVHLGDLRFRLSTPAARELPWHVGDRDARDWHPAVALGVGVALAIAVFALGALTGRRRGRRPLDDRAAPRIARGTRTRP